MNPDWLWVAGAALVLNLPLGWWRAGVKKYSWRWFMAIHAAVPLIIIQRVTADLEPLWVAIPLLIAMAVTGQALGAKLYQRFSKT